MMRAAEIASSIGLKWPAILERLGIDETYLRDKHGPCPACGGKDRYRFDNKHGRGSFYCNGCGAGDGFTLLQRVHGWDFKTARARVIEAAGMTTDSAPVRQVPAVTETAKAQPNRRVRRLRREACELSDCPDAIEYLQSRALWPQASRTSLRAHVGVDYFVDGQKVGRYPAILAAVRDINGELVTLHCTHLEAGRKLTAFEPRKFLNPMYGREGCAVRLQPVTGDVLGLGEGIETSLSAAVLHRMPVWAALNTALLAKFTPPAEVKRLVIFADKDTAGQEAADRLTERLAGRCQIERRTPAAGDWNDVLMGAT